MSDDIDLDALDEELASEGKVEVPILGKQKSVIPGDKEGSGSENYPKTLYSKKEFKRVTGSALSKDSAMMKHYYDGEGFEPFTGIEDVDKILNLKDTNFSKTNQLVQMWGCNRCWLRGTKECPFGIGEQDIHPKGYCDYAIKSNLIEYALMKTPDGIRHIRNKNLVSMINMANYYLGKLQRMKSDKGVSKGEVYLLKNTWKMLDDAVDKINNMLKQDEGIKITTEKKITIDQFQRMYQKYGEEKEKIVDGEIVEDEDEK